MSPTTIARPMGPDIYTVEGDPLRMLGIPFRTRMTVVKLADGGLWVHSPVVVTPERVQALAALGPIHHLVAPCTFHHLYVEPWRAHAPQARVWAAPGLPARYPDRHFDAELDDTAPPDWADEIDQLVFWGSKVLIEVVFFHRPSRTAIITDIVQNHEPQADNWFWRTGKRLNGIVAPNGGCPRDWRLTVRDRPAARAARDRLLAWPIERVILTHGRCITEGAHAHLERAFAWLG